MHGGWQLFSPTLLVEIEGSLLIKWVALYILASVWSRKRNGETHARARSPRRAGRGVARRWAHDVRVNSPSKSGPKPRKPATFFYRLFLLRVRV
jgi:hypothetical protein